MKQVFEQIWVGNETAQKDFTFFLNNKVSFIINLSSHEIENRWEHLRIKYLNYALKEDETIFDEQNFIISEVTDFIKEAK